MEYRYLFAILRETQKTYLLQMQPEGAVPPVVGVCYVKSETEQEPLVSFHVTPSEDMSIYDFLKKHLLPRLKRDSFETLEIC